MPPSTLEHFYFLNQLPGKKARYSGIQPVKNFYQDISLLLVKQNLCNA